MPFLHSTHLVRQQRELVLEPLLGEVGAVQLVVDPRAVGLLLEEQCQRVQPDLPSRRCYQPLVYLDSLDTHPVVAVGVGEEELVRGHGAALALDAVEPDACAHRDHHLAPCPAHLSHRTPGSELKHPEKQLVMALLAAGLYTDLTGGSIMTF